MPNPHPNTHGLRRGGPGRPKGSKNKITLEVSRLMESPEYFASVKKRVLTGKAPHLETYWLNKLIGKPAGHEDISGRLQIRWKDVHDHFAIGAPDRDRK
jgi:hypothetical protein